MEAYFSTQDLSLLCSFFYHINCVELCRIVYPGYFALSVGGSLSPGAFGRCVKTYFCDYRVKQFTRRSQFKVHGFAILRIDDSYKSHILGELGVEELWECCLKFPILSQFVDSKVDRNEYLLFTNTLFFRNLPAGIIGISTEVVKYSLSAKVALFSIAEFLLRCYFDIVYRSYWRFL